MCRFALGEPTIADLLDGLGERQAAASRFKNGKKTAAPLQRHLPEASPFGSVWPSSAASPSAS
jgi:hypothetical protein